MMSIPPTIEPQHTSLHLGAYDDRLLGKSVQGRHLVQHSGQVQAGDIFIALGSTGADGSAFISEAFARGASAALFDPAIGSNPGAHPAAIPIRQLGRHLGDITNEFYGKPSEQLNVVGVTGTNGKTSTVQMLVQAWQHLGVRAGSIGTLGAGLPGSFTATGLTSPPVSQTQRFLAEFLTAGAAAAAIEVSSHALVQQRVAGVQLRTAVFTNLTREHLDYHHSLENYAAAKGLLFTQAGLEHAVINLDDPVGRAFAATQAAHLRVIGVSSQGAPDATITAQDIALTPNGITFTLGIAGSSTPITSPLLGRFNVDNLLAVAGVLLAEGRTLSEIASCLQQLTPVFGRMNRIAGNADAPQVIIDYAHTPDALEQSLRALTEHATGRIITVFGCTGDRDRGKRPEMATIAERYSAQVIVTDDDLHHEDGAAIFADIRRGFAHPERVTEIHDRASAIAAALAQATPADIVLIAGKGHEAVQYVGAEARPYSDTETVTRLLAERRQNSPEAP